MARTSTRKKRVENDDSTRNGVRNNNKKRKSMNVVSDDSLRPQESNRMETDDDNQNDQPTNNKLQQPEKKRQNTNVTNVHRCRFIDWNPSSMLAVASNAKGTRVAVSRKNGCIEIWEVRGGNWHQSLFIPTKAGDGILCLSWYLEKYDGEKVERLFGADMGGHVFEVDLNREILVRQVTSFGGAVWSMDCDEKSGKIAIGCEDGCVKLFDILPGPGAGAEFVRSFESHAKSRLLAVRWHPAPERDDSSQELGLIYSAGVDGYIRKWDAKTGKVLMQLATESYGSDDIVCVWSLVVLSDSTVFSGDSEGYIHVWDTRAEAGTLIRSFNEHRADVMTLVASKDETKVFGSGIDSRVAMFQLVRPHTGVVESQSIGGDPVIGEWVYSYSHRPHSYDVRGLALVNDGKTLVSGGNDTQFCWFSVDKFATSRPVRVNPFLHSPLVHIDQQGDLMLVQHADYLELWQPKEQVQLLKMQFRERVPIRCSALSKDGKLVACVDENGLKVFRVTITEEDAGQVIPKVTRLPKISFPSYNDGIPVACDFDPSSKYLVCALQSGLVQSYEITETKKGEYSFDLKHNLTEIMDQRPSIGAIRSIKVSDKGQHVACGTGRGDIIIWTCPTTKKKQQEVLPPREISFATLDGVPFTTLTFSQAGNQLVIATMKNRIFVYDVLAGKMNDWTLNHGEDILDARLLSMKDPILGVTFHSEEMIVAWGRSYMCKINISNKPEEKPEEAESDENATGGKQTCEKYIFYTKYRPILFVDYIGKDQLLIVEASWLRILQNLEDPIYRRKYGGAN